MAFFVCSIYGQDGSLDLTYPSLNLDTSLGAACTDMDLDSNGKVVVIGEQCCYG